MPRVKILLDHSDPFLLAHGGLQIQIERTKAALDAIQVPVEYLRWWDAAQTGEIIHYVGRPRSDYVQAARRKGLKVVIAPLLTEMGSRSASRLFLQRIFTRVCRSALPPKYVAAFGWNSFVWSDACIALTEWEAHLMRSMFGAPAERVHVVPNGVDDVFLDGVSESRGRWLVCTATITERKRVLELARAAVAARTPLWIIGKPYSEMGSCAQAFLKLQAQHADILRYEGAISDREKLAQAYRQARGFVLLSAMESLSLSALEAAACECPLLLSDLPWARTTFGEHARYCPIDSNSRTADALRRFYDDAPGLKPPPKPLSWTDVARQLKTIYAQLLNESLR